SSQSQSPTEDDENES
nr:Chain I, peptide 170-184 from TRAF-interacting protein with FHA domain-containing protein A [Homo sapiens]